MSNPIRSFADRTVPITEDESFSFYHADDRFDVIVRSLKVVNSDGKYVLQSDTGSLPIPTDLAGPISWIIERGNFSLAELAAKFPQLADDVHEKLVSKLADLKAIAPA